MAQLDGEPVLCCGPEAPPPFVGEQWGERGDPAVHPQQEQLTDTYVQPAGRDAGQLNGSQSQPIIMSNPDAHTATNAAAAMTTAKSTANLSIARPTYTPLPMTSLSNPFPNPYPDTYPDAAVMETQLGPDNGVPPAEAQRPAKPPEHPLV